jgi:hypothetical protein
MQPLGCETVPGQGVFRRREHPEAAVVLDELFGDVGTGELLNTPPQVHKVLVAGQFEH